MAECPYFFPEFLLTTSHTDLCARSLKHKIRLGAISQTSSCTHTKVPGYGFLGKIFERTEPMIRKNPATIHNIIGIFRHTATSIPEKGDQKSE